MAGLTAQELTDMRTIADDFFPDTCTIQTLTESVDGLGGVTHSWANTYTGVACRLDPTGISDDEQIRNLALEGETTWTLNIPYDQAISVENRVVHDSQTYEVRAATDTNSYRTIRRALLSRVN